MHFLPLSIDSLSCHDPYPRTTRCERLLGKSKVELGPSTKGELYVQSSLLSHELDPHLEETNLFRNGTLQGGSTLEPFGLNGNNTGVEMQFCLLLELGAWTGPVINTNCYSVLIPVKTLVRLQNITRLLNIQVSRCKTQPWANGDRLVCLTYQTDPL